MQEVVIETFELVWLYNYNNHVIDKNTCTIGSTQVSPTARHGEIKAIIIAM